LGGNVDYAEAVKPILEKIQPIPRNGGHALVVDGGLTAGSWTHPDFGSGLLEAIAEAIGVDKFDDIDAVYNARR
jgi:hypothetical protein